ncbi:MFS general substrate transporter [Mycena floridula]|nr:MFS general substrate transporter [Mycena floridula]
MDPQLIALQPLHGDKSGTVSGSTSAPASRGEHPGQPSAIVASEYRPSTKQLKTEKVQFAALCWCMVLAGWNDGSTGPLLPRIQEVYNIGFAVTSILFILACVGFIGGAFLNLPLSEKMGSVFQMVAYTLQAPALPFPVFVLSYCINGIGMALQDAQANGYTAALKSNPEVKMGLLHASYVATQFAQIKHWSFHYLVSLGIATSNTILLWAVFRLRTQDECLADIGQAAGEKGTSERSPFRQIMGPESCWIVTFIIRVRGGGPSSGYISAGFLEVRMFLGLMVGRVALLWVNHRSSHCLLDMLLIEFNSLELVVWLVPSLIGDGVAVSIIGVFLGPIYPIAMNHASRVLPRWLLTGSIGWIAGFGQAGSAVFPFMTGALAQKVGIKALHPLLVAMMAVMIILWTLVPRSQRKTE